jgi:hypothetical protein
MMLPLLGEVTVLMKIRAFVLFLSICFFYSGTWSGLVAVMLRSIADMLLSNLGAHLPARVPRPYFHVLEREGAARPGSETAWLWVVVLASFVRARVCAGCAGWFAGRLL